MLLKAVLNTHTRVCVCVYVFVFLCVCVYMYTHYRGFFGLVWLGFTLSPELEFF